MEQEMDNEMQYIIDELCQKHFAREDVVVWREPGKLLFKVNIEGTWHEFSRVSH